MKSTLNVLIGLILSAFTSFITNIYAQTPSNEFVTVWDLSIEGSSPTALSFDVSLRDSVNYTWETIPAGLSGSGKFGIRMAEINGLPVGAKIRLRIDPKNFGQLTINNGIDRKRLLDVEQWGAIVWSSMSGVFWGCTNLDISAIDLPNLTNVTDMSSMFYNCGKLNGPSNIGNWNTANVKNMGDMFSGASAFNQPIGTWNTSNVISMTGMFNGASTFNQPIGKWNTGKVIDMGAIFAGASAFNQPIGEWNTSNVTKMYSMFGKASTFNQPIGNWNTGNVTTMSNMFSMASAFNQPIGNWNTSNVTSMNSMFYYASSFNQPIENWNTENVETMLVMFFEARAFNQPIEKWNTSKVNNYGNMFFYATAFNQSIGNLALNASVIMDNIIYYSGMDCANYSATLIGWANNPKAPNGRFLAADGKSYGVNASAARQTLIDKGWTIRGDVANTSSCEITSVKDPLLPVALYPNPTDQEFQVVGLGKGEAELYDAQGLLVRRVPLGDVISVKDLARGLYHVRITSTQGLQVLKLMVK